MKNILTLILLAICSIAFSQTYYPMKFTNNTNQPISIYVNQAAGGIGSLCDCDDSFQADNAYNIPANSTVNINNFANFTGVTWSGGPYGGLAFREVWLMQFVDLDPSFLILDLYTTVVLHMD